MDALERESRLWQARAAVGQDLDRLTAEAVALVGGRCQLESSGGLSLAVAADYARTGVDFLAVGALTHSAPILDLGADLRPVED